MLWLQTSKQVNLPAAVTSVVAKHRIIRIEIPAPEGWLWWSDPPSNLISARRFFARTVAMTRIDEIWLATEPLDRRAGPDTASALFTSPLTLCIWWARKNVVKVPANVARHPLRSHVFLFPIGYHTNKRPIDETTLRDLSYELNCAVTWQSC